MITSQKLFIQALVTLPKEPFQTMTTSAAASLPVSAIVFLLPRKAEVQATKRVGLGRLAKISSGAFSLDALIFPVLSGMFFSKSSFTHMLTQRENLAQSINGVNRRKKERLWWGISPGEDSTLWSERSQAQAPPWQAAMPGCGCKTGVKSVGMSTEGEG